MSFQERPGDSPHLGVCPQPPSRPSPQGAMTKVLTSCLSPHQASDSGRRPAEHTRSMDSRWQSPRPGRPGRGGPPASLDFSCSLPWPKPPPAPRHLGITTEAVSSSSSQPPAQPLQGSVDPALNPSLAFAASHLEGRGDEDHIWLHPSSTWWIPSPAHPRVCGQKQESSHMVVLLNGMGS